MQRILWPLEGPTGLHRHNARSHDETEDVHLFTFYWLPSSLHRAHDCSCHVHTATSPGNLVTSASGVRHNNIAWMNALCVCEHWMLIWIPLHTEKVPTQTYHGCVTTHALRQRHLSQRRLSVRTDCNYDWQWRQHPDKGAEVSQNRDVPKMLQSWPKTVPKLSQMGNTRHHCHSEWQLVHTDIQRFGTTRDNPW